MHPGVLWKTGWEENLEYCVTVVMVFPGDSRTEIGNLCP